MTARAVTVEVLEADETGATSLRVDRAGEYNEESNGDAGAFSITVPAGSNTGWTSVDVGKLIRFKVAGTADFTGVVEEIEKTPRSKKPANRQVRVRGRDWLVEFQDTPISPPMGVDTVPTAAEIYSDWRCPWIDTSAWPDAVFVGPVYHADANPLGDPWPSADAKPGGNPRNYPDPIGGWIWGDDVDGNGSHPVDQVCYFAKDLTVDAGTLLGALTCDDSAAWSANGVLRERGVDFPASMWEDTYALGEEVTSGTVKFRARAVNHKTPYPNGSNLLNPGAFTATFYQPTTSTLLELSNVIARTGPDPDGTALVGGGWKALITDTPPGMTWGDFYTHMFDIAQDEGYLTGWTLGFDATEDSDGNAWDVRDDMVARVNDTHLGFFKQSWASGWAEVRARPGSRVLDAYVWGKRGDFWTSPGSPTVWGTSNASQVDVTRRR